MNKKIENRDTFIDRVVNDFAPPTNEGYGMGMLIRLVRGNGTYTGNYFY